jgi:trimethylamine---corrinoid protein Co-methyltransferase
MKRNLHAGRGRREGIGVVPFTQDDCEDVHLATLEVLRETGVYVEDEKARRLLAEGGCDTSDERGVVKIPADVVEATVSSSPPVVLFAGRDPKDDVMVGGDRVGFLNFGEAPFLIDPFTGEHRPPTKADVADAARVCDALPEIDAFDMALNAWDVPPETADVHHVEAALANTTKCVCAATMSLEESEAAWDLAAAIVGGRDELRRRPIVFEASCPVSPLKLHKEFTDPMISAARAGVPAVSITCAMSGATTPLRLAGTMVVHNAEQLASLVLTQLASKGAGFVYGSSTTAMDMRYASASVGTPEGALLNAAVAAMARYYSVPSWVAGG